MHEIKIDVSKNLGKQGIKEGKRKKISASKGAKINFPNFTNSA